jgi:hypothetical protein
MKTSSTLVVPVTRERNPLEARLPRRHPQGATDDVADPGREVVVVLVGVGAPGRDVEVVLDASPVPTVVDEPRISPEVEVDSWGAVVPGAEVELVEVTPDTGTEPGGGDRTSR